MIFRSLLALMIGAILLLWSIIRLRRFSALGPILHLIGAIGLIGVGFAHLCEALGLLPVMEWGAPHSTGHYVDLVSALVAISLIPLGLLMTRRRIV